MHWLDPHDLDLGGRAFDQVPGSAPFLDLSAYDKSLRASWVWEELWRSRNIRPAFSKFGPWLGMAFAALEMWVLRGREPFTLLFGRRDYGERICDVGGRPAVLWGLLLVF